MSKSAPASIRALTANNWPLWAAKWRAVLPFWKKKNENDISQLITLHDPKYCKIQTEERPNQGGALAMRNTVPYWKSRFGTIITGKCVPWKVNLFQLRWTGKSAGLMACVSFLYWWGASPLQATSPQWCQVALTVQPSTIYTPGWREYCEGFLPKNTS